MRVFLNRYRNLMRVILIFAVTLSLITAASVFLVASPVLAESTIMTGNSSPFSIPADGISAATDTIRVFSDNFGTTPLAGCKVDFTLVSGPEGTVLSAVSANTDENGYASVTISSANTGTAVVKVYINTFYRGSISTNFTAIPASIQVSSNHDTIIPNGSSTSVLTATVLDQNSNPVAGSTINWSTDFSTLTANSDYTGVGLGVTSISTQTDSQGCTSVTLNPLWNTGKATITATIAEKSPAHTSTAHVTFAGATSISPSSGPAGTEITLGGIGFGTTPGTVCFQQRYLVNSSYQWSNIYVQADTWSDTSVSVKVPDSLSLGDVANITVHNAALDANVMTDWYWSNPAFNITAGGQVATPAASPENGSIVADGTLVTLSESTTGAAVYFTTDGSDPKTSATKHQGTSVTISGAPGAAVTVKAYAIKSGYTDSTVATFNYTIQNSSPTDPAIPYVPYVPDIPNVPYVPATTGNVEDKKTLPVPAVDTQGNVIIKVTPTLDDVTGTVSTELDTTTLDDAFSKATANEDGSRTVAVEIPKIEGSKVYEPTFPSGFLSTGDAKKSVKIITDIASVTVPGDMLRAADAAGAQNIGLTIGAADKSGLDAEVQAQIGDRPVIELNLKVDGKQTAWSNEIAHVTVAIPYTPAPEELKDPEHITVWYIDSTGKAISVPSGRYDPATGMVSFSITHFSKYSVAFVQKTFTDTGNYAWAEKAIGLMASKGVINGTSETTFGPSENINRADFLTFLVKTLGLTAKVDGNFNDVKPDQYYYEAVGIAKKLGITDGTGNNLFNPQTGITRQEMMAMVARAMKAAGKLKTMGTASDLDAFSDKGSIASYAVDAVAAMVKEGLIKGSINTINPLAQTSRAEAAVILYRIYNIK